MDGLVELGFSLPTLIAQLINVGVLLLLLYLVAYKPFMRMMDERSQKVKDSLDQAERISQQAAQADAEVAKRKEEATQEGRKIVDQAVSSAEAVRQKAMADAKQDAEKMISRARTEIQQERDEAIGELRSEFAELTILAAEKVIKRSLDSKAHRDLIDEVLKESSGLKNN